MTRRTLAVAVALVSVLVWAKCPADPPARPARGEPEETARRGQPVVWAVYAYRRDHGLWPCRLDDLCPRYAALDQVAGWLYRWGPAGDWVLQSSPGPGDWAVRYLPR